MTLTKIKTGGIQDDAVTSGKIPANAVGSSELADNAVDTAAIADEAVTLAKLEHGTSSNSGKFLRANNGADPTFETVNTDLVSDTTPQLGGNLASNGFDIVIADNDQIRIGTGNDLSILHNGTDSKIQNSTGDLVIKADNFKLRNAAESEKLLDATANGAVELYYDNSKKFETTSGGATLTGNLITTSSITIQNANHLFLADNGKARFGASQDLEIYHSGADSFISETGTGNLFITTSGFRVRNAANNENIIQGDENGAVRLYYDDSTKFETTSAGATVTGTLTATSFSGDGSNLTGVSSVGGATGVDFNDGVFARFGTGNDLVLYHNGNDGQLANSTGNLILANSTDGEIFIDPKNNERGIVVKPDAGTELYHNNIKKLETESSGINVTSSTPLLNFNANNVAQCVQFQVSESSGGGVFIVKNKHTSGNLEEAYRVNNDGTFSFSGAGVMNGAKLNIANNGTHITCKSFSTGGYDSIFFRSANTNVGKIFFNSGGTQYHTSSDYRRKQNIVDLTGAINRIKGLLPKRFNFISEPDVTRDGFLAHEVTGTVPEAISGTKDQVATEKDVKEGRADEIGDPVYQTIDQAALIPLLTAAIKELISRVEALEAA